MKHFKISILVLLAIGLTACDEDYLDRDPISAITSDSYYNNEDELLTGIINMYDGIQGINSTSSRDNHGIQIEYQLTEMYSDNTETKSSEGEQAQFQTFNVESTNGIVTDYYRSMFNVIFRANVVLENIDVASDENRLAFEGEAKFVRAYTYFQLVRLFGDLPMVDKVLDPLDYETQFTRVSTDEIYALIESDLQVAIAGMGDGSYGRGSRAAAQALLAKVYLTRQNYTAAIPLLESVMSAGYELESDYQDVFYSEGNNEVLFAIVYDGDDSQNSQNFSAEWLNSVGRSTGLNYVTVEAAAAIDALGGTRAAYTYRVDPVQPTKNQVAKYIPNGDSSLGIESTSSNPVLAGNDWIILRYSDVLLMYAEAVMGEFDLTNDPRALGAFQEVRNRAGLTDAVTSITKQELLDERRVELAFENKRWFDLQRFGVALEVLSEFSNNNGYQFSATDLLLPIPQNEIGLSKGLLTQNPGY
ncbi:RagB/SusD family nutrient uptake outer membrane protein [Flavobacteriaceae bacterium]|nr:RagB/SusD family nutrient uptake outer membrane protein [Flavobacteriaceae bacterium]